MVHLSGGETLIARMLYILLAIVAFFGVLSNFSLLLLTIKSKNLRSTCHILIGLCAALDGFHQIGQFFQFPVLFSDGMIDSFTCSILQILPEIGVFGGCACVLCIGLERLTAVIFVTRYKKIGKRHLTVHLMLIAIFGSFAMFLMVAYYQPKQQICAIPAPYHGAAAAYFGKTLCLLNGSSVAVYCAVAKIMSMRTEVSPATRAAFRSNFFVMTADVSGWVVGIGLLQISHAIDITDEVRFISHYVCGLFINSGIGAKMLIYVSTSGEYRQAFRIVFRRFNCFVAPATQSTLSDTISARISVI